ncbi:MAG: DUF3791 domain-containing protein [Endomicrobium sp.]|nr:DUF3791 domain-containing protein [Endomicrobium sp.]
MKNYNNIEFVTFCIEIYGGAKDISGREAYEKLNSTGALDYIDECYEGLHVETNDGIVWNIDEFINNNQVTV